jgi:ribosome biogenesis protein MAK21
MDMLFRITHSSNFNTSIQALMLIQQLATSKNIAVERFYRTLYESLLDPRLINSSKHAMYLNLLFRSLKSDLNIKRVKAFAKRLLQIITLHQPPFISGVLYLIRELETTFPALGSLITDREEQDDDDEEVFKDVPDDVSNSIPGALSLQDSHIHPERVFAGGLKLGGYDGRKRDPEHSNADKSCLWELVRLKESRLQKQANNFADPFLISFPPLCLDVRFSTS